MTNEGDPLSVDEIKGLVNEAKENKIEIVFYLVRLRTWVALYKGHPDRIPARAVLRKYIMNGRTRLGSPLISNEVFLFGAIDPNVAKIVQRIISLDKTAYIYTNYWRALAQYNRLMTQE